jgi:hypothetical protein
VSVHGELDVLVLCHARPNYVPDLLLHGLRKLLGPRAVDFPRKDSLYAGELQAALGPLPDLMGVDTTVDRTDVGARLRAGFYDFVIVDARAFADHAPLLQSSACPMALLDGEDVPISIDPGPCAVLRRETDGRDGAIPVPMALPIELIDRIERQANAPKRHSIGFLGGRTAHTGERNRLLDALAGHFPDALLATNDYGAAPPIHDRDEYYRAVQGCRTVLSLPGAGYDTFRYWENAACNALHLARATPLLIPEDFRDGREIVRFTEPDQLLRRIEDVEAGRLDWRACGEASRAWLRAHHTTERRAAQVLSALQRHFNR